MSNTTQFLSIYNDKYLWKFIIEFVPTYIYIHKNTFSNTIKIILDNAHNFWYLKYLNSFNISNSNISQNINLTFEYQKQFFDTLLQYENLKIL